MTCPSAPDIDIEIAEQEDIRFADGRLTVTSRRYPFCAVGASDKDDSLRSGMALIPSNKDLNRFTLNVKGGSAANYKVTWGDQDRGTVVFTGVPRPGCVSIGGALEPSRNRP